LADYVWRLIRGVAGLIAHNAGCSTHIHTDRSHHLLILLSINVPTSPRLPCLPCAQTSPFCSWYYVELHMPFRNDYGSTYRGLAIRMMGELASNNCTSTRQVPTHVEGGQLKYLLNQPDPSGDKLGSKFVDTLRGVTVILERWTNTSAVVRIIA
jgi:hypothetical protein